MNGYKTYILSALFTLYAVFGAWAGLHDWNTAAQIIQTSGIGATIRHAIARDA